MSLRIRPSVGAIEYPALVALWRRAVDATHGFLAASDRDEIQNLLATEYLPAVVLTVAELDGRPVGFAGVADDNLQMLFVDPLHHRMGIGSTLLDQVITAQGVRRVDFNEQNVSAAAFYTRRGFLVTGRSETDEAGRPYPLLHLRLSAAASRSTSRTG